VFSVKSDLIRGLAFPERGLMGGEIVDWDFSIWKEKCDHSPEIQTFKTLSLSTSFEKLESNL
jgi:hypothetical protein